MFRYIKLFLLFSLSISGCSSDTPSGMNKLVVVENKGIIKIDHIRTIPLEINSKGNLGGVRYINVADRAFFLTDGLSGEIHKYDFNGVYVGTIGEQGKATGQFLNPLTVEIDSLEYIYISDGAGKLLVYDSEGKFIRNIHQKKRYIVHKLEVDKYGDLLELALVWEKPTFGQLTQYSTLLKVNPNSMQEVYSLRLSDKGVKQFASGLGLWAGFGYIPKNNRIYHQFAWDCRIREIDANTGKITNMFEIHLPGYTPITMVEEDITPESVLKQIKNGILQSFNVINERYLLVRFSVREDLYCYVLDLNSKSEIKGYLLNHDKLSYFANRVTTFGSFIYVYTPPSLDEEENNGSIAVYTLQHNI